MRKVEILNGQGEVVGTIKVGDAEDVRAHLPHYPGATSWREVDSTAEAAEEAKRAEARAFEAALARDLAAVLHAQENRIRALEGQPPLATEEFRDALKPLLGL